jgi:hypothetical protein
VLHSYSRSVFLVEQLHCSQIGCCCILLCLFYGLYVLQSEVNTQRNQTRKRERWIKPEHKGNPDRDCLCLNTNCFYRSVCCPIFDGLQKDHQSNDEVETSFIK